MKTGKPVSIAYENDVWAKMVICMIDDNGVCKVVHNVAYTYDIIRRSAIQTREEGWSLDPIVAKLQFSNKWIEGFLHRRYAVRRRITRTLKDIPNEEEVRALMAKRQDNIQAMVFRLDEIANMDETVINWGIGPTHVFCPSDAERGEQNPTDDKARVTGVVTVLATGEFLPLFFILKHSKSSLAEPDQTHMTVIKLLHQQKPGFKTQDGWRLEVWERPLTLINRRKEEVVAVHKVRYLRNETTGAIITSQYKAWNDTVRMAMLCDLVYGPYLAKAPSHPRQLAIWMDNFSAHKTDTLTQVFRGKYNTVM
jgi:hypothetical protein